MKQFYYFHPMTNSIQLSESLRPFGNQLMQSRRTFLRLKPNSNPPIAPWNSAIGGLPYWPKGLPFQTDEKGEYLLLLAQINFEEVPALPPFPEQGLLQFFISDEDLFGKSFENPFDQSNFRVVFHSDPDTNLDNLISDFTFLPEKNNGPFEKRQSFGLDFNLEEELMPFENHRFESVFGPDFFQQYGGDQWAIIDEYFEHFSGSGHKIGGYPFFTQTDPRSADSDLLLLLQIDTDADLGLMWGDMGVANFFIAEKDLQNLDFSNVYFHWDCH